MRSFKEVYLMSLDHDKNMLVLKVKDSKKKGWVEVRGKKGYETTGYDKNDELHKVLDKLDAPTVAKLMSDDEVVLNPKNPRTSPAIKQAEKILK
jgi:hypothetical protein